MAGGSPTLSQTRCPDCAVCVPFQLSFHISVLDSLDLRTALPVVVFCDLNHVFLLYLKQTPLMNRSIQPNCIDSITVIESIAEIQLISVTMI